jgi:hypothetical protein
MCDEIKDSTAPNEEVASYKTEKENKNSLFGSARGRR